jgi:hypothetical protein
MQGGLVLRLDCGYLKLVAVFSLLLILTLVVPGCTGLQSLFQNPKYIYEQGAILVDGADLPIELQNNPEAVVVSYRSLQDFLHQDTTDLLPYIERDNSEGLTPFVCSDFAELVHNNAEAAGIRAGYVSIDWIDGDIGHAINAFETTDQGLVFIDCTGKSEYSQVEEGENNVTLGSWDKVAYLVVGRKYGVISTAYAESADYAFYERFEAKWDELKDKLAAYNAEVKLYNQEIRENTFMEDSPELERIKAWEDSLIQQENVINALSQEVGYSRFRPLGIVDNYVIHW